MDLLVLWLPPLSVVLGEWGLQVDGELADVAAGLLAGGTGVQMSSFIRVGYMKLMRGGALGEGTAVTHAGDVHLLEDHAQNSILLVPADSDENQEVQLSQRLFTCAP